MLMWVVTVTSPHVRRGGLYFGKCGVGGGGGGGGGGGDWNNLTALEDHMEYLKTFMLSLLFYNQLSV